MRGEEIMQIADDIKSDVTTLENLGEKWGGEQIDEKTHDEATKLLHKVEEHVQKLYENLGRMQFGPCPDMAYEFRRQDRAEEALQRNLL